MLLTDQQKQVIIDNYGNITSYPELSILACCKINQIKEFIKSKPMIYFVEHKTRLTQIEENNFYSLEPEFSPEELEIFENSKAINIEKVEMRIDVINGQSHIIFQSRMNYG